MTTKTAMIITRAIATASGAFLVVWAYFVVIQLLR